jgi:uncharacterized protein YcbX
MSQVVGRIAEIWRYPVKSMGGERVPSALLSAGGIPGDRGWALYDEEARQIRNAKLLPKLLMFSARYAGEPAQGTATAVAISGPDGASFSSERLAEASAGLSSALGRRLRLSALEPASNTEHYRQGKPDIADPRERARASFALEEGDPMPDASRMASLPGMADLRAGYAAPLGTYFDVAPLHLISTTAQATLGAMNPSADADARRFRPNLVIETEGDGFPEFNWAGKSLQIGDAILDVRARTLRCAMPTHAQPGLDMATSIMRTLVRETMQDFGVYALISAEGEVQTGDTVVLRD